MGGFGSGRWSNHKRKYCVEEFQKQKAAICPVCGRGVRFVYSPPNVDTNFATQNWACRFCQDLTYLSCQTWGTLKGDLVNNADLLCDYVAAAQNRLIYYQSMPVELQTIDQMLAWMDTRDKQVEKAKSIISMCNRIPDSRLQALYQGKVKSRPLRRRKTLKAAK